VIVVQSVTNLCELSLLINIHTGGGIFEDKYHDLNIGDKEFSIFCGIFVYETLGCGGLTQ